MKIYPYFCNTAHVEITDEYANIPCENNWTCVDLVNGYDSFCEEGFTGTNCLNSTVDHIT